MSKIWSNLKRIADNNLQEGSAEAWEVESVGACLPAEAWEEVSAKAWEEALAGGY